MIKKHLLFYSVSNDSFSSGTLLCVCVEEAWCNVKTGIFPTLGEDLWQPGKLKASICSTGQQRVQWPLTQICPLVNIKEQAVDRGVNDTDSFCDIITPSVFIKHILFF